jgi:uncharacterized RDD family membrane protein YckC
MAEKIGNEVEDFLLDKVCLSLMYVCYMCLGLWVILMKIPDIRLIARYIISTLLLVELYFLEIGYQLVPAFVWTVHLW